VLLGSQLSIKVPENALRIAFAFILVLSGIKLVEVPAATTIIEVGVGLGAVALVVWSIRQVQQRRLPAHDAA
jgi:tRNA1(Val) A37 N6-methylase TrmN6